MAKKKKAFDKRQWVATYKEYVLEKGTLPGRTKDLCEFAEQTEKAFNKKYTGLEQLETAVIALYFKEAHDLLISDEEFNQYSTKEKQLAFLYMLIEMAGRDEDFLLEFHRGKKRDKLFAPRLLRMLKEQDLAWATMNWPQLPIGQLDIGVNPKQMTFVHHGLSTMVFFLKDTSPEKQDTDAYIEKSTDVLFRLTDTSTIRSVVDFGKFLFARKQMAFSWD